MNATVDLNCDLGEGFGRWRLGDDEALLPLITSANVACGYHAGDPSIMRRVCEQAASLGVAVGAQVAYPDLVGFGRRFLDMHPDELSDAVVYQIGALDLIARVAGTRVSYVKCHGALYHATIEHQAQADAVVRAITSVDRRLVVLGAPGSALLAGAAEQGVTTAAEAFVDRSYDDAGRLVSRQSPGSVITSAAEVARRAVQIVDEGGVHSSNGNWVSLAPASLCLHGDTPGAVELARAVREALEHLGVGLRPFAPT